MIKITKEQVLKMHTMLIQETGGLDGLRDVVLLESSLMSAFQSFDGTDLYPELEEKAARLAYSFVKNHAFVDGNKRIGVFVMLVFLELNGIELSFTQQELIQLGLGIADGSIDDKAILNWIVQHK